MTVEPWRGGRAKSEKVFPLVLSRLVLCACYKKRNGSSSFVVVVVRSHQRASRSPSRASVSSCVSLLACHPYHLRHPHSSCRASRFIHLVFDRRRQQVKAHDLVAMTHSPAPRQGDMNRDRIGEHERANSRMKRREHRNQARKRIQAAHGQAEDETQ